MFKISNKPNLYNFLLNNVKGEDNKEVYKKAMKAMRKEKVFRNTEKLEASLNESLNFKMSSSSFLFDLSSRIFEFSRRAA